MKTKRRLSRDNKVAILFCDDRTSPVDEFLIMKCLVCSGSNHHVLDDTSWAVGSYAYHLGELGWISEIASLSRRFGDGIFFEESDLQLKKAGSMPRTVEYSMTMFQQIITNMIHHGVRTPEDIFRLLLRDQVFPNNIFARLRYRRRRRVFLSSTFLQLKELREKIFCMALHDPRLHLWVPKTSSELFGDVMDRVAMQIRASHIHVFVIGSDPGSFAPIANDSAAVFSPRGLRVAETFVQLEWRYTHAPVRNKRPILVYLDQAWEEQSKTLANKWEARGFRFDVDHNNSFCGCGGRCWSPEPGWLGYCRQAYWAHLIRTDSLRLGLSLADLKEINWIQFTYDLTRAPKILIRRFSDWEDLPAAILSDVSLVRDCDLPSPPSIERQKFATEMADEFIEELVQSPDQLKTISPLLGKLPTAVANALLADIAGRRRKEQAHPEETSNQAMHTDGPSAHR